MNERHEAERVDRQAAQAAREQAEHDAEQQRKQELHDLEVRKQEKALAESDEALKAGLAMLMGTLAKLGMSADEFLHIKMTHAEFASERCIVASACGLIKAAAEKVGTPEALKEAADKLLDIAASQEKKVRKIA